MSIDLPFLDVTAPGFSTRGQDMIDARARHWCARTPYGLAILQHRQAGLLLRDRRLRQGSYAWPTTQNLKGSFADFWSNSVISQEGPEHKALRQVAQSALSEDFILTLRAEFTAIATDLISALPRAGSFEFMSLVSEPFAGRAITTLLNLSVDHADAIARDASTLGLGMGLDAKTHETAVNDATDRLMQLADALLDRAASGQDTTSFAARMAKAAPDIPRDVLKNLIVISIFGGVDTTRAQLGLAMSLFSHHPDQWTWLRANPDKVPQAIEEIIRTRPTTTWSTREALEDFTFQDVAISKGETLHIFVHATGTDPNATNWEAFDVRTPRKVHFGFGGGAHHCLGQFVARTDMACALRVMLDAWDHVSVEETARFLPDSGNTSPDYLPVNPDWA